MRVTSPSSFLEYLAKAQIESDAGEGIIPFALFPFQRELAERWDAGESMVILKRRQAGLSWLAAHYCLYSAMFRRGHNAVLSMGQREADEFLRKVVFAWRHLPEAWRMPYTGVAPMKFANGNIVQALPSTENAGISFTFARMFCDEAAAHPYGEANYGQYRAAIANGQYLCFSAANPKLGPSGFFYDMWQAAKHGEVPFAPVFVPRNARPDQDAEWFEIERKAYAGQPETFEAIYPESPEMAFVGKSGLVLPEFSHGLHVTLSQPREWQDYDYRFAGIDPGGGDPTAIVPIGSWRDAKVGVVRYHQPGEFYSRKATTIDAIVAYLSLWHNKAPFTRIWVDTAGGEVLLESLRQLGFPAYPAIKDRDAGITAYRGAIVSNRLTLHESCTEGIKEFAGWRWMPRKDANSHEAYTTGTPVDNHADAHDARRYVVLGAERAWARLAASEPIKDARGRVKPAVRMEWAI